MQFIFFSQRTNLVCRSFETHLKDDDETLQKTVTETMERGVAVEWNKRRRGFRGFDLILNAHDK